MTAGFQELSAAWVTRARRLAEGLEQLDRAVYQEYGRDPLTPILGEGPYQAHFCIFGRDPGRDEIRHATPFVGAGGKLVRAALARPQGLAAPETHDDALRAGAPIYWANTVPYKPIGNVAWSKKVVRSFYPVIAERLSTAWRGREVLALGREAAFWFGLENRAIQREIEAFWAREDRYQASLEITWEGLPLVLSPLPHPSPLNARWYRLFPELMDARLRAVPAWTLAAPSPGGV